MFKEILQVVGWVALAVFVLLAGFQMEALLVRGKG